jgi:hypothetical protein
VGGVWVGLDAGEQRRVERVALGAVPPLAEAPQAPFMRGGLLHRAAVAMFLKGLPGR